MSDWSDRSYTENRTQHHLHPHYALFNYSVSFWTHQPYSAQRTIDTDTQVFRLHPATEIVPTPLTATSTWSLNPQAHKRPLKISAHFPRTKKYQSFLAYAVSNYQTS